MRTLSKLLSRLAPLVRVLLGVRYGLQRRVLKSAEGQAAPNGISSAEAGTIGGVKRSCRCCWPLSCSSVTLSRASQEPD